MYTIKMWQMINKILKSFRICFTRKASYKWFIIITVGCLVCNDSYGVTSVVRDLNIDHNLYQTMLNFFRSNAWNLEKLIDMWISVLIDTAPIIEVEGYVAIVGDGVKQSKEGKRMPGVKKLHQESENSTKPEYIFGHMYGAIGVLIGNELKKYCTPISVKLHDGVNTIRNWNKEKVESYSHVVQMIMDAAEITKKFGKTLLILDRYFLSVSLLMKLEELNAVKMHIITKAKKSCTAYYEEIKYCGRGRKPKKGQSIKVMSLFKTKIEEFIEQEIMLYGKKETVKYYCIDLLWGQKLYKKLRFVLVEYNGVQSILVSTMLNLDPCKIIEMYSWRFKIECCFRELKQVIKGFSYHFWSKKMPKLNRFKKKNEVNPIEKVIDEKTKKLILGALKAIEGYVFCNCVAIGILQILSIKVAPFIDNKIFRFIRTVSKTNYASELTISCFLRKHLFSFISFYADLEISQIINEKQNSTYLYEDFEVS
jgi:hypothetical protein